MANPQKENGYTPIANEIMEALCRTRIPGGDRRVLDAILRFTYGWHKCEDHISMGQIAKLTGLKRQNVNRSIKALHLKNIITVIKNDDSYLNLLKFNKDYETWVSSKLITIIKNDDRCVIKSDDKTVIRSDSLQRKKERKDIYSRNALEVLSYLNSKTGRKYRDASYIEARLKDGGTFEDCARIIDAKLKDPYFIENPRYLNPITLFRKSHWDIYLNEPEVKQNIWS